MEKVWTSLKRQHVQMHVYKSRICDSWGLNWAVFVFYLSYSLFAKEREKCAIYFLITLNNSNNVFLCGRKLVVADKKSLNILKKFILSSNPVKWAVICRSLNIDLFAKILILHWQTNRRQKDRFLSSSEMSPIVWINVIIYLRNSQLYKICKRGISCKRDDRLTTVWYQIKAQT